MSGGKKNVVLGIIIVVAISVAGYLAMRSPSDRQEFPDDPALASHWIDVQTGEHFVLSPAKLEEWNQTPNKQKRDAQGRRVFPAVYFNPETNEYTIVSASYDAVAEKWYATRMPDGTELLPPSMQESGDGGQ